jgi:glycyl-tRNA synthetase
MKKHQRYFPIYNQAGSLLPYFVLVRNGDGQFSDVVADGNEQVVRARFADASFFIAEDMKHKLEDFLPRLGTLTFQVKLGTMLDKTHRVQKLVEKLMAVIQPDGLDAEVTRRAALLCKADLVTHMVIEMTSLAGIMGRFYAEKSGEAPVVAQAVFESTLPRSAGDALPKGAAGLLVGLADRLDTLSGLFAAGLMPSGTKDPFAQRRAALAIVQALIAWDMDFDLRKGLEMAAEFLPIPASAEALQACSEFITGRLQNSLLDEGQRFDVVTAVLAEQGANPAAAARAVQQLTGWVRRADWSDILPAYSRCVRITRDQAERYQVDPAIFDDEMESALWAAIQQAESVPRDAGSVDGMLQAFLPVIPVINQFFDKVLVMAEDSAVRANRLGMLQRIAVMSSGVADFSRLEGF